MSKIVISSNTIVPSTQIIDYFNGKYMFYVENPFFKIPGLTTIKPQEFLAYKKIENGTELKVPKIYYKYNNTFVDTFSIDISDKRTLCKFFGAYTKNKEENKIKSNNKFLLNFGKYHENHELKPFLILNQQLSLALEFLMISKLLDIEISRDETDISFINKVCELLSISTNDSNIEDILNTIQSSVLKPIIKENDSTETNLCFFDKFKTELISYVKKHFAEKMKTNPIIAFYGGKADSIYGASSVRPAISIVKTIKQNESGEDNSFNNVSGKFGFILKLPKGKNDFFATKLIENKKAVALTYDNYMSYVGSKTKKSCKFVVTIGLDIRRFNSGPLVTTKINVEECIVKESVMNIQTYLIDDDEENKETQDTLNNDVDAEDFLN